MKSQPTQSEEVYVYFRGRNRVGAFVQGCRRSSAADLAEQLYRNRYEDVEIRYLLDGNVVGGIQRIDGKRVWWGECR